MPTRVTTLGRLAIRHDDDELTSLPGQPVRCALLVYLAVEREASRDTLMALLWPDSTEEKARHALNQTMYELRRLLGEDWATAEGERVRVAEQVTCDAAELEAAVDRDDHGTAIRVYGGAFMEGTHLAGTNAFETWVDQERARLARLHRRARRQALDALMAAADHQAALAAAREWAELEPLDDEAQHRFIEFLAATGHRSGALEEFERYARRLKTELDVEPLDETLELVERIRAGDVGTAPEPVTPTGTPEPSVAPPPAPVEEDSAEPHAATTSVETAGTPDTVATAVVHGTARSRRRGLAWAGAAAVATVVGVWLVASLRSAEGCGTDGTPCVPLDPSTFVVFPPRIEASGPPLIEATTYAYSLRDAVARWRDLRLADPLRVADALRRRGAGPDTTVPVDTALAVARELGAGRVLMSVVTERPDGMLIQAQLYDATTGRVEERTQLPLPRSATAVDSLWAVVAALVTPGGLARLPTRSSLPVSLAAHRAYAAGEQALAAWRLDSAATHFRDAISHDTTFGDAYLRLAQSLDWAGRQNAIWAAAAEGAVAYEFTLDAQERVLAAAELALAEDRYPDACRLFARAIELDSASFAGWYGLGECRARDDAVVVDASSPSGFAFRSSYHAANLAYRRALEILPSFSFHAFRNGPYHGLTRTLFTDPLAMRTGRLESDADRAFAAYPSLRADTLAFVPYPPELAASLRPGPAALNRNRETLRRIVGAWARAFPNSAQANHARALVLESFGEIEDGPPERSAPAAVQRARALTVDTVEQLALTLTEARLALKRRDFDRARSLADSAIAAWKQEMERSGKVRGARSLADSAIAAWADPGDNAAAYLAGLEALVGHGRRAASLFARATGPDEPYAIDLPPDLPGPLLRSAHELWAFAGFGMAYEQSILDLEQRVRLYIRTLVEPRSESQVLQALLSTPAVLLFHERGPSLAHVDVAWNPTISMQRDLALHDTASVEDQLNVVEELRDPFRPGDFPVHETLAISRLYLAVGDTAGAVRTLDGVLETLFTLNRRVLDLPQETASLVHAMALRARLADAAGDIPTTRHWAAAVTTLWSAGDRELQPLLTEMDRLSRRSSVAPPSS